MGLDINQVLKIALEHGASDIHIKAGMPPNRMVPVPITYVKIIGIVSPRLVSSTLNGQNGGFVNGFHSIERNRRGQLIRAPSASAWTCTTLIDYAWRQSFLRSWP